MKKAINIAVGFSAALELWIFASWVNVVLTNCDPALETAAWNIFNIF